MIDRMCSSGKVVCSRTLPVLFRWPLLNYTSGHVYGELEVLEGDEPADVIHSQLFKLILKKPEFLEGLNADFDAMQKRMEEANLYNSASEIDEKSTSTHTTVPEDTQQNENDLYGTTDERLNSIAKRIVDMARQSIERRVGMHWRAHCTSVRTDVLCLQSHAAFGQRNY